jgi:hypothetical protein
MSVALPAELLWNVSVSIAGGTSMEYVSEHCRRYIPLNNNNNNNNNNNVCGAALSFNNAI